MIEAAPVGRRAAMGGAMMVGARLFTRLIDMATMLALARILLPADFGLVAVAASMVAITEAVLELPLNQALLRLPVITAAQYDTAFTLSLLRGVVLSSVLVLAAWPAAMFYGNPRLVALIAVLSLGPAARGLTSPRLAEYQKTMSFWRDFAIELVGKLAGFTLGLLTALTTHSYWAIAVGSVSYPIGTSLVSYWLAPYRPRLTLSQMSVFTGFVGWMSAAQVISAINWQFERLLIGKLKNLSQLGLFTTSSDIAGIPYLAIFGPLLRPMLAAFTLLLNEPPRLARSYQTASSAIMMVGLPVLVGESLVAEPVVRLLLGHGWLGAIPLMRWLALSLTPALFGVAAGPLVMALGRTEIFARRNALELSVKLPVAIAGALAYGFPGIIAARFAAELAANIYCVVTVHRLIGLPVRSQLLVHWRCVAATATMAAVVLVTRRVLPAGDMVAPTAVRLAGMSITGAVTYVVSLWALWRLGGRPPGIEMTIMTMAAGLSAKLRRVRGQHHARSWRCRGKATPEPPRDTMTMQPPPAAIADRLHTPGCARVSGSAPT